MTTPVYLPGGDPTPSFFTTQMQTGTDGSLIEVQVDPSQPQVSGLSSVTDPLIPDRLTDDRVTGFDPNLYDLRSFSHLMKLLRVLLGAAGVGGLRKQMTVNRMAGGALSTTSFLDLDGFWGGLFNLQRLTGSERLPSDEQGTFSPATYVAGPDTWDSVTGADASYRSKILQVAQGFAQGATYAGLMTVAEALLNTDVEIQESWVYADLIPPGTNAGPVDGNTWYIVEHLYTTYGGMRGVTYQDLSNGTTFTGQTPIGNRGEVTVRPKRGVTPEERRIAQLVIDDIKPSGVLVTILDGDEGQNQVVTPRHLWSDSEEWLITSEITPNPNLVAPETLYPADGTARPAFSQYSGEQWSYNNDVSSIRSYQMVADVVTDASSNYQSVQFLDGQRHDYLPLEGLLSGASAEAARSVCDGVLTAFPYSQARVS